MPGSEGRKMFIAKAEIPASRISVRICGGVLRSRKRVWWGGHHNQR